MARQLESKISKDCIEYLDNLKKLGYPLYYEHRSGSGGFNYKKGIPDLYVVIRSTHIECEIKTPYGKLSPMQEKWRDRFLKWGTPYINPRSVTEFVVFIDYYLKEQ